MPYEVFLVKYIFKYDFDSKNQKIIFLNKNKDDFSPKNLAVVNKSDSNIIYKTFSSFKEKKEPAL